MGFLGWIFGFNAEAQKQADRLTDGIRRLADLTHGIADHVERGLMVSPPQVEVKSPEKKRSK